MTVKPGWARKHPTPRPPEAADKSEEAPQPSERALWELDRGELRALLITFAGGVASIVAAALIIGGAIAIARRATGGTGSWAAFTWSMGVFFVLAVIYATRTLRGGAHPPGRVRLVVGMVLGIFSVGCFGLLALGMLVLIGIAAGIK
jgi:hypothetical protein